MNKVAWFSGGVASAVTCYLALQEDPTCDIVFLDTLNEDDDTYRFMDDCERWYGKSIERVQDGRTPIDIWEWKLGFNFPNVVSPCTEHLKIKMRQKFQKEKLYQEHFFGFDVTEAKRAFSFKKHNPELKGRFPLIERELTKEMCFEIVETAGIQLPYSYRIGFNNNNCLKTGCINGGIGYWREFRNKFPDRFEFTASLEHKISSKKGKPIRANKDFFLKKNPEFPEIKCLDDMGAGRHDWILGDCNGFCLSLIHI